MAKFASEILWAGELLEMSDVHLEAKRRLDIIDRELAVLDAEREALRAAGFRVVNAHYEMVKAQCTPKQINDAITRQTDRILAKHRSDTFLFVPEEP